MVSKSTNWGYSPSKWPKWLINGDYYITILTKWDDPPSITPLKLNNWNTENHLFEEGKSSEPKPSWIGVQKPLPSLKLTIFAPENGWLEYDYCFLLGQKAYFQGLTMLVSGRVIFSFGFSRGIQGDEYNTPPTSTSRSSGEFGKDVGPRSQRITPENGKSRFYKPYISL